jgi:hypothetical protein
MLLRKFLRLSIADRWLVGRALLLVAAIRLALAVLPYQRVLESLARLAQSRSSRRRSCHSPEQLVWAVRRASLAVPGATCLAQALAGQLILILHGYDCMLRVGFGRGDEGRLDGHAWLEHEGRVVLGDDGNLARYTLSADLNSRSASRS